MNRLTLLVVVLAQLMLLVRGYESPKPSKYALRCLIEIYRTEEFRKCGSEVSIKWNLNDEGVHDLRQKCCSIFDLWDCINTLATTKCTKGEHNLVKVFKQELVAAANKNECQAFNYLSNECAHEETENVIL